MFKRRKPKNGKSPSRTLRIGGGYAEDVAVRTNLGPKQGTGFGQAPLMPEMSELFGVNRDLDWRHTFDITEKPVEKKERIILQTFNMSFEYIRSQLGGIANAGYTTIQLSPVNETLQFSGLWWELYQPISYLNLNGKLGTEQQLRQLIKEAHDKGLEVLVDVVLNHMADALRYHPMGELHYPEFSPENFSFARESLNYSKFWHYLMSQDIFKANSAVKIKIRRDDNPEEFTEEFKAIRKQLEPDFYLSEQSDFYNRFKEFVEKQGNPFKLNVPSKVTSFEKIDRDAWRACELMFLKEVLPTTYEDFLGRLKQRDLQNDAFRFDFGMINNLTNPTALESFKQSAGYPVFVSIFEEWFGISALILQEHMWNVTAGAPVFENEWDDLRKVWVKWFPGLPELDVHQEHVQSIHTQFLKKLLLLGVDGFRVDAIKHVPFDYMQKLFERLALEFKNDPTVVDGQEVRTKKIYSYGEMATDDLNISNDYRRYIDVTDFFLCDTMTDCFAYGGSDVQKLRLKALDAEQERWNVNRIKRNNRDLATHMHPVPEGQDLSYAVLTDENSPLRKLNWQLKSAIVFSRLHDSVVGTMFKVYDYPAVMLMYAYLLAAARGTTLIYSSDEDLARNAGADYKERMVVAGVRFRQLMSGIPYNDRYEPMDYSASVNPAETLFIDRGNKGLAIITRCPTELVLKDVKLKNLKEGRYRELLSNVVFEVSEHKEIRSINGQRINELRIPAKSAAFIVPA